MLQKNPTSGWSRRARRTSCTQRTSSRLSIAATRPARSATGMYCSGVISLPSSVTIRE